MALPDRLTKGYEPRFDIDYELGRQGELVVMDILSALRSLAGDSVEVKTDMRAIDTGKFYVEYECLRKGRWEPSGIQAVTAEWWGVVVGGSIVFARTEAVRELVRQCWNNRVEMNRGSHPTRGVLIPIRKYIAEMPDELTGEARP